MSLVDERTLRTRALRRGVWLVIAAAALVFAGLAGAGALAGAYALAGFVIVAAAALLATRDGKAAAQVSPVLAASDDPRVIGYVSEAYALKRFAHEMERQHSAQLGERDLFNIGSGAVKLFTH